MDKLKALIARLNVAQERQPGLAVAYGMNKKFSDDRANLYVVSLGWYGFLAIFPTLLLVVTVLGYIGAESLGHSFLNTLSKFPIVGTEFKPGNEHISGNPFGLVVGLAGLLYGGQGVTNSAQQAFTRVWNIPQYRLPGFFPRFLRSVAGLATIGAAFLVNAAASGYATGHGRNIAVRIVIIAAMAAMNVGFYLLAYRLLSPAEVPTRALLPGSIFGAISFTLLITVGTGLVQHQLNGSNSTYGAAGGVIGLVTFLLLLSKLSIYATELNVVLDRHLYPRALPTCDPLPADRRVYRDIAQGERRHEDERVGVGFPPDAKEEAATDAMEQRDIRA